MIDGGLERLHARIRWRPILRESRDTRHAEETNNSRKGKQAYHAKPPEPEEAGERLGLAMVRSMAKANS
jgi:hypothetical protein